MFSCRYLYRPPAKIREGNVFSRLCFPVCLFIGEGRSHVTTSWTSSSKLFIWRPLGPPPAYMRAPVYRDHLLGQHDGDRKIQGLTPWPRPHCPHGNLAIQGPPGHVQTRSLGPHNTRGPRSCLLEPIGERAVGLRLRGFLVVIISSVLKLRHNFLNN